MQAFDHVTRSEQQYKDGILSSHKGFCRQSFSTHHPDPLDQVYKSRWKPLSVYTMKYLTLVIAASLQWKLGRSLVLQPRDDPHDRGTWHLDCQKAPGAWYAFFEIISLLYLKSQDMSLESLLKSSFLHMSHVLSYIVKSIADDHFCVATTLAGQ